MIGNHDAAVANSLSQSAEPLRRCDGAASSANLKAMVCDTRQPLPRGTERHPAAEIANLIRRVFQTIRAHSILLGNSAALLISTSATAAIGFVFWWIAAKHFTAEAVGVASAAIAMMNFLGLVGECGLGTLLIGESLRKPGEAAGLISAAIVASVASSGLLCFGYLAFAYGWSFTLAGFLESGLNGAILLAGCAVTALAMVLDSAFVGLLRSFLQTWRTFLASILKLTLLLATAWAGLAGSARTIVLALLGGQILSILVMAAFLIYRRYRIWEAPNFRLLRQLVANVLGHHLLNLAAQSPSLVMPLMVASMLSAEINAAFYAAWMAFNVILLGPAALTTLLFTVGVAEPARVQQRLRLSLWICGLASPVAWLLVVFGAGYILSIFGSLYATQGGPVLKVLGVAVFGVAVKYHYIAVRRLGNSMASASLVLGAGAICELAFAAFGARMDGLIGLTQGWVIAVYLEALAMTPALVRFACGGIQTAGATEPAHGRRRSAQLQRSAAARSWICK
jgi:O-antigen/teichoic acid export membrane protein